MVKDRQSGLKDRLQLLLQRFLDLRVSRRSEVFAEGGVCAIGELLRPVRRNSQPGRRLCRRGSTPLSLLYIVMACPSQCGARRSP